MKFEQEGHKIVQGCVVEMVGVFKKYVHDTEHEEFLKEHYQCVLKSVIGSFTATIVHGWCDLVVEDKKDYEDAFHHCMAGIFGIVLQTLEAKQQMLNKTVEVH